MRTTTLQFETGATLVTDVTDPVEALVRDAAREGSAREGLAHLFLPHATCGLALVETGSGSEGDLADAVERLLPRGAAYRHRHGSTGHGADHVLPAFVSPSLVLPVEDGRLLLGTWQRVVIVDPNRDNATRTLRVSFVPVP